MHIKNIRVKNFRLLQDVQLQLENPTTVIVGRNNSGKTSITELFRRILNDVHPRFCLEDFSLISHQEFFKAFSALEANADKENLESQVPFIEIVLVIDYSADADYGTLNQLIIDLNPDCSEVHLQIRYQLKQNNITSFFDGIRSELDQSTMDLEETEATSNEAQTNAVEDDPICAAPEPANVSIELLGQEQSTVFYKLIRERIQKHFKVTLVSVNPSNPDDTKAIEWAKLRSIIQSGFVNAQRGLDDITQTDRNTLGKILESLFNNALSEDAGDNEKTVAMSLETTVRDLQQSIDSNFTNQLSQLLPSISLFGYPGLRDQEITTETNLDAARLLKDHTKILYSGANGINLPESYNGLGARNLIFILLKLLEFFNDYKAAKPVPSLQIIFIEEPEAHLHPQMQTVFGLGHRSGQGG